MKKRILGAWRVLRGEYVATPRLTTWTYGSDYTSTSAANVTVSYGPWETR